MASAAPKPGMPANARAGPRQRAELIPGWPLPYAYPVCFDVKKPVKEIRQYIVHGTFKIVYRIKKDKIEVLEIFHGNRNPAELTDI